MYRATVYLNLYHCRYWALACWVFILILCADVRSAQPADMRYSSYLQKTRCVPFCLLAHILFFTAMMLLLTTTAAAIGNASPQTTVTFGAWSFKCEPRIGSTVDLCVANQLVTAGKAKRTILGVMVSYSPEHPMPHIIFRLSPKANVEKGAAVKVDELASLRVPISNCNNQICEVRSFIPEVLLSQMRSGKLLQFAFFLNDKQVTYLVSLEGFDKTYMALQVNSM